MPLPIRLAGRGARCGRGESSVKEDAAYSLVIGDMVVFNTHELLIHRDVRIVYILPLGMEVEMPTL